MKFGILGAGNIAGKMATTINKMKDAGLGDVELYAVASRNPEKAEAFAEKIKFRKHMVPMKPCWRIRNLILSMWQLPTPTILSMANSV